MEELAIGDTVEVIGPRSTGVVGTYIWKDRRRDRYLVRISHAQQLYFTADELVKYRRLASSGGVVPAHERLPP